MAGHSKFKNIMHRKGAQDARKSRLFSKLSREITVAAKQGGTDIESNARLRLAIQNARGLSMPKDNIERALKKAESGESEHYEEMRYEGYGPGGSALIVEALTDNRNRTAGSIRSLFTKAGGSLGETGAVSFMFDRIGEIIYPAAAGDADYMLDSALKAGAQNIETDDEEHVITCAFEDIGAVSSALATHLGEAASVKAIWQPQTLMTLPPEKQQSLYKLMLGLDEDDDVQNVFTNCDLSDIAEGA